MPSRRRGAPPWWPEGEQWPPRRGRRPPFPLFPFIVLVPLGWLLFTVAIGVLVAEAVIHGLWLLIWVGVVALCVPFLMSLLLMRSVRGGRLRRLTELARRLEATDERRRTFLAELAHELRTPLALVRAQAEAISEGVYPGDAEHVAPILEATAEMEALTADLRTLAESDAGALELAREAVPLADLLADVAASFAAQAVAAGVRVDLQVAAGAPAADADPGRLRRVLANLVSNALAHTPAGGSIRLGATRSGGECEITVADTGSGIDPELAGRAFERFVKGPGSRGSGLGLSIASDIVAAHGGTIELGPNPGGGTVARLRLPAA